MTKNLLLISQHPDDRAFSAEVAQEAGLSLTVAANLNEGVSFIREGQAAVIFADASSAKQYLELEAAIQSSVGLFSDSINANSFFFISGAPLEEIEYLLKSPIFGHYVHRSYGDVKVSGPQLGRVVKASLEDRCFGLSRFLKAGTRVQTIELTHSSQKLDAADAVRNYLLAAKFQSRMAAVVANAVDELIMNAIFDAPVDELGRQFHAATLRSTAIDLSGKSAIQIQIGFDGVHVGITVADQYGSLDKMRLLQHISKVYRDEEYKVRAASAGAGIGLATVFRTGGSFIFASENRVRTEVTVLFQKVESFRMFKGQFRFLSTQFYF